MKTRTIILAAALAAFCSASFAEDAQRPDIPTPRDPLSLQHSTTLSSSYAESNPNAASSSSSRSASDASNALSIGGDNTKSVVAVFPPPSTAVVPAAQNCIVTKSNAGGIGWNLIQGAGSEQYSDPVCVLQWMEVTATSADERASIRAEILKQIGVK